MEGKAGDIEKAEEINAAFLRRAQRKEFPIVKYIVYLQYAGLLAQDAETVDSLLRYGFDVVYEKLRWLDKAVALQVASEVETDYLPILLDKFACDALFSEYVDLASNLNASALIQIMGIYHKAAYQRQELWLKLEQILINLYLGEAQEQGRGPLLNKESLFLLIKVLTERKMSNPRLWELIHKDVE